ncbi:hypothetical protein ACFQ1S_12035 [Kibdelosporangium lantanae]|uniref:Uncharacterized protein n=1 Tax=Kibdelosporangium lantanae TaxID=1497396 RepID=A0ABW3M8L2_9PSEU
MTFARWVPVASSAANDHVLTQRFLDTIGQLSADWQKTSGMNTYALRVTPGELAELSRTIDDLLMPYRTTVRTDAPPDAQPIHASWRAFPRVEADGKVS